jgi:hypothetical protein
MKENRILLISDLLLPSKELNLFKKEREMISNEEN